MSQPPVAHDRKQTSIELRWPNWPVTTDSLRGEVVISYEVEIMHTAWRRIFNIHRKLEGGLYGVNITGMLI